MAVSKNGGTHPSNLDQFTIETLQYACVYTCIYNYGDFLIIIWRFPKMVVHIIQTWTSLLLKHYNTHVYIYITIYISCIYNYGGFLIITEVS